MGIYIQELVEKWLTRNEAGIPKVEVDSSGLPSGASTEATVDDIKTAVENTETMVEDIVTAIEILDNIVSGSEAQVDVVAALPAGSNTIGDVGIVPRSSGGCLIFRSIDLDESEEEVKASEGQVFAFTCYNKASSVRWVKFYNDTAANVVVGTTTPVMTVGVPLRREFQFSIPHGIEFNTAITIACTQLVADNDTTAPAANEMVINVFYK